MNNLSIKEIQKNFSKKEFSSFELTKFYLDRIEKTNPILNSCLKIDKDNALDFSKNIDYKKSFLAGIPYLSKSVISRKNFETNAASKILKNFKPVYNATVLEKLDKKQAVFLGNTNLDEFAQGSSNEYSAYLIPKNPWNLDYITGGSSGGSASAVASNQAVFALGTDTGGSIRVPAAFCGVVGSKFSYGRVSRYGVMSYASSLDTVGVISKTVEDSAVIYENIAGKDYKDDSSLKSEVSFIDFKEDLIKNTKIAYFKEFFNNNFLNPKIKNTLLKLMKTLEKEKGVEFIEFSFPELEYAINTYFILAKSEGSSNYSRYDGIRYGQKSKQAKNIEEIFSDTRADFLGEEVKRCIMLGNFTLSEGSYDAYFKKAALVRRLIYDKFQEIFKQGVSAVYSPVTTDFPFKIGSVKDPVSNYYLDYYTVPMSLAGLPSISLPIDIIDNFPVALQITTNHSREDLMFNYAKSIEDIVKFKALDFKL
jgi:aspartyl-tRNA(Asn)/glutamyl-tRNA(Gln) amidotransferase subunit A